MGWVEDYVAYAEQICDAPRQFHKFVALTILGASLGNRVWFVFGDEEEKIYPCLWTLLLAPSSTFRKSSAIRIGRRMLYNACSDEVFLPSEFSPEVLWKNLSEKPDGLFILSEFLGFVDQFERKYMSGAKQLLVDLFDNPMPRSRRTQQQGKLTIRDSAISMLSGSTTEWFLQSLREGDLKGGFLARWVYVPVWKKEKRLAYPPSGDTNLKNQLVERLNRISQLEGKVIFSNEAMDHYKDWFKRFELGVEMSGKSDFSAFYVRLEMYCLKLAVLLEVSETVSLEVSVESMKKACSLTNELYNNLLRFVEEEFALSKNEKHEKRVVRLLKSHGDRLDYPTLLKNSHLSARELKDVINTLEEQERVRREYIRQDGRKKAKQWVIFTE